MTVNLTANCRLIRTLEPLLKRSEAGRAVLISSGAAQFCRAYWGPYSVSKAGLEALAKTWAAELESTPVKVSVVNPGPVRTAMRGKIFPGEDPAKLADPSDIAPLLLELAAPSLTQTGQRIDYPAWRAARPV
jgi:NAD(P)-dependent dehydrogenase (short-subunit alcohol dehydrogenase family)